MAARDSNFANAFETTVASVPMSATDLTVTVASTTGLTSPCYLVFDPENTNGRREYVYFDGTITGSQLSTTALTNRYLTGSAAGAGLTHPVGEVVRFSPLAQHFEDIHDRIDTKADTGHGHASTHPDLATHDALGLATQAELDAHAATGHSTTSAPYGVRVFRSAALAIANATLTAVAFDAESFDDGTIHDNVTNPSRLTVPAGRAGRWHFRGHLTYDTSGTGVRQLRINKNGVMVALAYGPASSASQTTIRVEITLTGLVAGDYIELIAYQTSGGGLSVVAGSETSFFEGEFLGA